MKIKLLFISFLALSLSFNINAKTPSTITPGADSPKDYLPILKGKTIAVVANAASLVSKNNSHLVDFLLSKKINIYCIFSPEHGFRGNADAGEKVYSDVDPKTGLKILSLYDGNTGKPDSIAMQNIDAVVFDLQDVGLRYYTYLTTMARMMEACAEHNKLFVILDRPNPNGHYVDGPILDMKYKSAVGWLQIPVVHGMTLGEMAQMINGEYWLTDSLQCKLHIAKCRNYTHDSLYTLPHRPSPNLPNMRSIYLYPALCYFEATPVSLGRGTELPFQCYGHPNMLGYNFSFTPKSVDGAKNPPLLNKKCFGIDLSSGISNDTIFARGVDLSYVIDAYNNLNLGSHFFRPFFEKLIGVDYVRKMIMDGKSAKQIAETWKHDVEKFKQQRKKYLIYEE